MEVKRKEREEEKARQREEKMKARAAAEMSVSDEGTPVKDETPEQQGNFHVQITQRGVFDVLSLGFLK